MTATGSTASTSTVSGTVSASSVGVVVSVADGSGVVSVGGVRAREVSGRWWWVRDVFELDPGELRRLARGCAGRVTRTMADVTDVGEGSDAVKVRYATETRRELAAVNEARFDAGTGRLSERCVDELAQMVMDRIFGLGELSRWWANPLVENIDVNGPSSTVVTFAGGVQVWVGALFDDIDDLVEVIRGAARRLGIVEQGFDARSPKIDVQLPDGARLTAVYGGPRLAGIADQPYANVRRHRNVQTTYRDLPGLGLLPGEANEFIAAWVLAGGNLIVAGDWNAGKTTALRAWSHAIPSWHRVITVESGLTELGLDRAGGDRNVVVLHSRHANAEGEGEVTVGELIDGPTRRLNPTRVIAGEINRGDEVIPILDCMTGSTRGSMFTIHARTAAGVVARLETYALRATPPQDPALVRAMVIEAAPLIVHLTADQTAEGVLDRYVTSIVEVVGVDRTPAGGGQVLVSELWALAARPNFRPGERTPPALVPVGALSPASRDRLARFGWVWARDGWAPQLEALG